AAMKISIRRCAYSALLAVCSSLSIAHAVTVIDEKFDSPDALKRWQWMSDAEGWPTQVAKVSVDGGALLIEPYTSYWLAGFHAPFLMREYEGDFVMTTRVKTEGLKAGEPPRRGSGSYIGLMARKPAPQAPDWKQADENYVLLATGSDGAATPAISVLRTVDGRSQQQVYGTQQNWHELRLVRIGNTFISLHRLQGQKWKVTQLDLDLLAFTWKGMSLDHMTQPNLPAKLQLGLTASTDFAYTMVGGFKGHANEPPAREFNSMTVKDGDRDLRAHVDYFKLDSFSAPASWKGKNLNDLSEADLLKVLGDGFK
ncbi:MAG: hypothetical protein V4805_09990, partial [Pseudomonadota bacterium]